MQLKITTDYSIRAMLYLAIHSGRTVTGSEIASAMKIPPDYIRGVLRPLKQEGLITATRGSTGGWMLMRPAEEISLYQIISLSETTMRINRCIEDDKYCNRHAAEKCPVHALYSMLQQLLEDTLKDCTLAKLIEMSAQQSGENDGQSAPAEETGG